MRTVAHKKGDRYYLNGVKCYISGGSKAGLITVRIFGVYDAAPGSTLYATPDPAKTYRFGADGIVGRDGPACGR